jgi:squalene-hopene/tetraprenyl-beta-curcumene cyclase
LQQAVAGGLDYLTDLGVTWKAERQCASCHHVPVMLWALGEARGAGFAVDETVAAEFASWSLATDGAAKVIAAEGSPGAAVYSLAAVYTTLGVSARSDADADPATRDGLGRMAAHIVSRQQADGSWAGPDGRPPLFDKPEVITLLSALALSSPALRDDPAQPQYAAARDKALAWLVANPTNGEHQSLVLRLLAKVATSTTSDELRPLVDDLLARQNADGGWRQTPDMRSDAFATGQSLYALRAAGIPADDAAIRAGAAFLINSQSADGSWPMTSRPLPSTGASGANLAPITYSGTAWGVIGLARCARE